MKLSNMCVFQLLCVLAAMEAGGIAVDMQKLLHFDELLKVHTYVLYKKTPTL